MCWWTGRAGRGTRNIDVLGAGKKHESLKSEDRHRDDTVKGRRGGRAEHGVDGGSLEDELCPDHISGWTV